MSRRASKATVAKLRRAFDAAVARMAMGSQVVLICARCGGHVTTSRQRFAVLPAEPRCTCRAHGYELCSDPRLVWPLGMLGQSLTGAPSVSQIPLRS